MAHYNISNKVSHLLIFYLLVFYSSGSQSVVRVPLVVREISLVVRRGISELNINQAACPPKRFFFNCFKWERLFHAEHSGVFFLAPRI